MNIIGKKAYITDRCSIYYGEWGIIKHFDGEFYHIAIANGTDSVPLFERWQFKIRRNEQ